MAVPAGRRRVRQGRGCGDRYTGGGVRPGCGGGAACPKCHGPPDLVGLLCEPQKRARAVPVSMRGCGATVGACRGLEVSHCAHPGSVRGHVAGGGGETCVARQAGRGPAGSGRAAAGQKLRSCRGIAAELGRRCAASPRRGSSSRRRETDRPKDRERVSLCVGCCIWFACVCAQYRTSVHSSR